jgi:quercetin dioxygenase-like cupin family protein
LELNDQVLTLEEGEDIVIPKGTKHRVHADKNQCIILEISYGRFDENDIVRLEDDYQRTVSRSSVS